MAVLFIMAVNCQDTTETKIHPPESGKFFYVDFPQHEWHGQHAITAKLRNRNHGGWDSFPLYFTTQQQGLSLINDECPKSVCKIVGKAAQPYSPAASPFYSRISNEMREPGYVAVYDRDDRDL